MAVQYIFCSPFVFMYKILTHRQDFGLRFFEGRHAKFAAEELLHYKPSMNDSPLKNTGQKVEKSNTLASPQTNAQPNIEKLNKTNKKLGHLWKCCVSHVFRKQFYLKDVCCYNPPLV